MSASGVRSAFGDAILLALQIRLERGHHPLRAGKAPIDVAQRDDVVVEAEVEEVGAAHAADADAGDVEPIAGRRLPAAEHVARNDRDGRGGRSCPCNEIAS